MSPMYFTSENGGRPTRSAWWINRAMRAIFAASSPMRSRSVMVFTTIITMRRSDAVG